MFTCDASVFLAQLKCLLRATKSGWIQMHLSFIVMRRLALRNCSHVANCASSRMPWSRVRAAIRSSRAYRFISRSFIAPATPLTRLVYDSDADAAARQIKRSLYHWQLLHAPKILENFISLSSNFFPKYLKQISQICLIHCSLGQYRRHFDISLIDWKSGNLIFLSNPTWRKT